MGKRELRQQKLIHIIKRQGVNSIKMLSNMLNVSEMTIRRDLEDIKLHLLGDSANEPGNAQSAANNGLRYSLFQALNRFHEQKEIIGKYAASLIAANDVIIIDTGSTTSRILPYIPEDKNLTVLCFNANVVTELRHKQGIRLLVGGGVYHPDTELFDSPEGIQFIQRTRATKVFLSAAGVHRTLGVTCENAYEVATKKAIIDSSLERILMADSDKFNKLCSAYFCDLSAIHTVVTDNNLSEEWQARLTEMGIALHLA